MVTILIATKNRPDFLIRSLRYYRRVKFRGPIHIADSSEPMHVQQVKGAIRSLTGEMNIVHHEYPSLSIAECQKRLIRSVSTKYIANVADSSFLVPGSLERCVEFLEKRQDYVAAHGEAAMLSLTSSGVYGEVESAWPLIHRSIEGETAARRVLDHLSNYSETLYGAHRTETWRVMWENASSVADRRFGEELLPACLSVVCGKVKKLQCLSLVRHIHNRRYLLPDMYDWITSASWPPAYQIFRDCLEEELARRDGLSVEEAREVVKQAFWSYFAKGVIHKWQVRYGQNGSGSLRQWQRIARRIPGLQKSWRKLRSFVSVQQNGLSLETLLRPSSAYHGDFMPIYRAVSNPPGE